jgi:hypothetical protein
MVLSKLNSGKYLTKEWNDPDGKRQQCVYDQRQFTAAERAYYEVYGTGINDGLGYMAEDAFAHLQTEPLDPVNTPTETYDHRDKKEVGR